MAPEPDAHPPPEAGPADELTPPGPPPREAPRQPGPPRGRGGPSNRPEASGRDRSPGPPSGPGGRPNRPDSFGPGQPPGPQSREPRPDWPAMERNDPKMTKLIRVEFDLERRTQETVRAYGQHSRRSTRLKVDLKKLVSEQFEIRQQRRNWN